MDGGLSTDFYGFSTCAELVKSNTTVCGCSFETAGGSGTVVTLPMDLPFALLTANSVVRPGASAADSFSSRSDNE